MGVTNLRLWPEPRRCNPRTRGKIDWFCANERVDTDATTVSALYLQLRQRHGLPESGPAIRAAVNDEFADWGRPLAEGDVVAFMPPVSGG